MDDIRTLIQNQELIYQSHIYTPVPAPFQIGGCRRKVPVRHMSARKSPDRIGNTSEITLVRLNLFDPVRHPVEEAYYNYCRL